MSLILHPNQTGPGTTSEGHLSLGLNVQDLNAATASLAKLGVPFEIRRKPGEQVRVLQGSRRRPSVLHGAQDGAGPHAGLKHRRTGGTKPQFAGRLARPPPRSPLRGGGEACLHLGIDHGRSLEGRTLELSSAAIQPSAVPGRQNIPMCVRTAKASWATRGGPTRSML